MFRPLEVRRLQQLPTERLSNEEVGSLVSIFSKRNEARKFPQINMLVMLRRLKPSLKRRVSVQVQVFGFCKCLCKCLADIEGIMLVGSSCVTGPGCVLQEGPGVPKKLMLWKEWQNTSPAQRAALQSASSAWKPWKQPMQCGTATSHATVLYICYAYR